MRTNAVLLVPGAPPLDPTEFAVPSVASPLGVGVRVIRSFVFELLEPPSATWVPRCGGFAGDFIIPGAPPLDPTEGAVTAWRGFLRWGFDYFFQMFGM